MTIQLPPDLESSIKAAVHNGTFANVDDAMAQAARLLLREIGHAQPAAQPSSNGMGSIGAMTDAADELDDIVADAMKRRREEPWRTIPGE
jgi:Arc/MetJ-type ribon-helix-helix transcriptional regulator